MARVTVEDCLEKVNSRFLLVMLASKRAKALFKGGRAVIQNRDENKNVVLALREIASGKVGFEFTSRRSHK